MPSLLPVVRATHDEAVVAPPQDLEGGWLAADERVERGIGEHAGHLLGISGPERDQVQACKCGDGS